MLNRICLEIFELLLLQSTDVCQGSLLFLSNGMEGSCTACHAWSIWTMVWKWNDECPKDEDMKLPLTDPSREWYHFTRVAIYLDPGVWMNFNPWSWEDGLLVRRPWLPLALHDGICVYIYTHFHILYLYIYKCLYHSKTIQRSILQSQTNLTCSMYNSGKEMSIQLWSE